MNPYDFREDDGFQSNWRKLKLTDDDLFELQLRLMINPDEGKVIPGSKGLRKLRIKLGARGKRGGGRVIYAVYHALELINLINVYAKNE